MARNRGTRLAIACVIAAVVVLIDQATKAAALSGLST
ncbi:MAG TPA: signal peptidase II, partial [Microbacterium sp.]|nr:signal peptidase II [Microbacterium sp.]